MAADLGPTAALLYLALCDHANRAGGNKFKVSDRALAADTGIAERTILEARKAILARGLITYERQPGKSHEYTLIIPTLTWKAQKERPRQKKKPRADRLNSAPDEREVFEERAAIIEFEGGLSRTVAERLASEQIRTDGRPKTKPSSRWQKQSAANSAALTHFTSADFA
jgi:DNA-binding transcriptional MocR family regulator